MNPEAAGLPAALPAAPGANEEALLPAYWPTMPLTNAKIQTLINNLAKDESGVDHAKIGDHINSMKKEKQPVAPLSPQELDHFMAELKKERKNDKDELMKAFLKFCDGQKQAWKKRTKEAHLLYIFKGQDNWVDHLAGLGEERDIEGLVPRVVDNKFVGKTLDASEWMSFVTTPVGSDTPIATMRARCYAGEHLLEFLISNARKIMGFVEETQFYINSANNIISKLKGQARAWKEENASKKRRKLAQELFASDTADPVEATGHRIQAIRKEMSKGLWELLEDLNNGAELSQENMTKLSQGVAYMIALDNGQRPQAYVAATQADLYTMKRVELEDGNIFWCFTVGNLTPADLKTDNIVGVYFNDATGAIVNAYKKIRAMYIENNNFTTEQSDLAPFFLRGRKLDGLDSKNMRNRWKEALPLNYRQLRDQNATLQRLAGASAPMLGAHSEAVVTENYFTAHESMMTAEMAKVIAYQHRRGLITAPPDAECLNDDKARELTEENKKRGREFLRRQQEREKVNAAAKEPRSTKHNHIKMRTSLLRNLFQFSCPYLSEAALLKRGLRYTISAK